MEGGRWQPLMPRSPLSLHPAHLPLLLSHCQAMTESRPRGPATGRLWRPRANQSSGRKVSGGRHPPLSLSPSLSLPIAYGGRAIRVGVASLSAESCWEGRWTQAPDPALCEPDPASASRHPQRDGIDKCAHTSSSPGQGDDLTSCSCRPILQIRKLRLTRLRGVTCPRSLGQVWNAIELPEHTLQPLQVTQLRVRVRMGPRHSQPHADPRSCCQAAKASMSPPTPLPVMGPGSGPLGTPDCSVGPFQSLPGPLSCKPPTASSQAV